MLADADAALADGKISGMGRVHPGAC